MPTASDIDDVIAFAATDIAVLSYDSGDSLFTQNALWIDGMFGELGIFPPSLDSAQNPGQRVVTDWLATNKMAQAAIEGPLTGDSGVIGTSAVINAVVRTATAVKFGAINGYVTGAKQTAVVTLFNTVWA